MSNSDRTRRERVERNLFKRRDAQGKDRFELSFRDSTSKQRFSTLPPGTTLSAARAERDSILGARGKGQHVQPSPRLRFAEASTAWLRDQVSELRPTTQAIYENAV